MADCQIAAAKLEEAILKKPRFTDQIIVRSPDGHWETTTKMRPTSKSPRWSQRFRAAQSEAVVTRNAVVTRKDTKPLIRIPV
jgi:hypothetical protein